MALPILLQKLFANAGVGPLLRTDILPSIPADKLPAATDTTAGAVKLTDVLLTKAQSLNASQKGQVRTNIGLGTAAVKAEGDFVSSAELTTALSDLITEFGGTVPAD